VEIIGRNKKGLNKNTFKEFTSKFIRKPAKR